MLTRCILGKTYGNNVDQQNVNGHAIQNISFSAVLNRTSLNSDMKYVLIWTPKVFNLNITEECSVRNCFITDDKNFLPVENFNALIFHIPKGRFMEEIKPSKRSQHQRYIFFNRETPLTMNPKLKNVQYILKNFFNWTMTYRPDSDIRFGYGDFKKQITNYEMPSKEFLRNKTRAVAWFVSNCKNNSRRGDIARKLSKYIDVDIYGKCGNLSCPRGENKCYEMVENKYRFYLGFENSYCNGYVTEKMYRTLRYNVIPIVYGAGDYKTLAPPHSVINVEDFDSVESLADYLQLLTNNDEKYLSYFEWKRNYIYQDNYVKPACRLCEMLNDPEQPRKVYEDIEDWYFGTNSSQCRIGSELPRIVFS